MKLIVILLVMVLTACGGGRAVAPVGSYDNSPKKYTSTTRSSTKPPVIYTVKKGDTLYSVSWRYGMDYKTLASINGIKSPYNIYVGQKLRFKSTRSTQVSKASVKSDPKSVRLEPVAKTTTNKVSPSPVATTTVKSSVANKSLQWHWPTRGKIISTYSHSEPGRKGIDISGKSGQSVVAAAAGKVVYSGDGLPRYGNLLIIKHNDVYLSAYAHNKTLLVKEGQHVKAGQKIATLGRTGTQREQLHFEIRRNGKPVDPMRFLPKR